MPLVETDKQMERYKDFVTNSQYGKAMQDPNWSKIKANWTNDYVYVEKNGHIAGAMSIIGIKNDNGKHFLYAPRGPVCDFKDYDLVVELIKEAEVLVDKYDAFLLRMDPEVDFNEKIIYEYEKRGYDFRTYGLDNHAFTQPRYNMILEIASNDEDTLFENFSSATRRNIRKSYRNEIKTVRETNEKTIDTFYELTTIMADRQGIGHRPKDYFQRLCDHMGGEIFTSYYKGEPLSSSILVAYNDKVYYLYAASSNDHRNKMPNFNMIWEEIKWSKENGYKYFDFGGVFSVDSKDGLYRFKEGFCYPDKYTAFIGELDVVYDRDKYNEFITK